MPACVEATPDEQLAPWSFPEAVGNSHHEGPSAAQPQPTFTAFVSRKGAGALLRGGMMTESLLTESRRHGHGREAGEKKILSKMILSKAGTRPQPNNLSHCVALNPKLE